MIDLEGGLDVGVPTVPNQVLYIYFPILDEDLPDLEKLDALALLGATLVGQATTCCPTAAWGSTARLW